MEVQQCPSITKAELSLVSNPMDGKEFTNQWKSTLLRLEQDHRPNSELLMWNLRGVMVFMGQLSMLVTFRTSRLILSTFKAFNSSIPQAT